jgi:hypothetical protein
VALLMLPLALSTTLIVPELVIVADASVCAPAEVMVWAMA